MEMKQIIVTPQTLEVVTKHGATSMLWVIEFPFEDGITNIEYIENANIYIACRGKEHITSVILPLQVDDDFYIADGDGCRIIGLPYFTTLSVEGKRVQDLSYFEVQSLNGDYGFATKEQFYDWLKEQNIDYNENLYVGLINFKEMT